MHPKSNAPKRRFTEKALCAIFYGTIFICRTVKYILIARNRYFLFFLVIPAANVRSFLFLFLVWIFAVCESISARAVWLTVTSWLIDFFFTTPFSTRNWLLPSAPAGTDHPSTGIRNEVKLPTRCSYFVPIIWIALTETRKKNEDGWRLYWRKW